MPSRYNRTIFNVDSTKLACMEYESVQCGNPCKVGDVVARDTDDGIEIGVVLQVHDDSELRTDMFGNACVSELFFPSMHTIKQYRPTLWYMHLTLVY